MSPTLRSALTGAARTTTFPGAQALRHRRGAAAQAYEVAKERLLDGSYQPGMLLSENELARELGISRTPVREAFLQLEAEDLIELYPRRGALVKPIEPSEADDVLEARLLIETHCAARVAGGDERLSGTLRALVEEQELALQTGDGPPFVIADREFHRQIVDANGNPLLTRQYDALRDRQQRFTLSAVARDRERVVRFVAEHAGIVEAIAAGDGREAAARLDAHLRGAHELSRRSRR